MRVSRAKQIRKHLRFYRIVYGITPPYSVLLDGNFIHMALKVKMDIKDRIKKVLLGEDFVCYVPSAVFEELKLLGAGFESSLEYATRCCEILESSEGASPAEAIIELIGDDNKNHYMVATQDQDLRAELRQKASVAILFVSRAVMLMEPPSTASKAVSAQAEGEKFRHLDDEEKALVKAVKKKKNSTAAPTTTSEGGGQPSLPSSQMKARIKKKPKGPNPLSIKKGHKPPQKHGCEKGGGSNDKKKRKRKKNNKAGSEA